MDVHIIGIIEGRCPVCLRPVRTCEIAVCDTDRSRFDVEFRAECTDCCLSQRKSLSVLYIAEKGHVPSKDAMVKFGRQGFDEPILQDSMSLWGAKGEVFSDV